jgi:hypothetical protein
MGGLRPPESSVRQGTDNPGPSNLANGPLARCHPNRGLMAPVGRGLAVSRDHSQAVSGPRNPAYRRPPTIPAHQGNRCPIQGMNPSESPIGASGGPRTQA